MFAGIAFFRYRAVGMTFLVRLYRELLDICGEFSFQRLLTVGRDPLQVLKGVRLEVK